MYKPSATLNEKRVVYCVALSAFVFQFEAFLVNVSLPDMAKELKATSTEISFVIIAYLLAASVSFIPAGRLGAQHGLRRVFLIGCALASFGTLASGLSQNLPLLCVSRLIQGAGTGTMVAMAYAMIPFWVAQNRVGWGYGMLSLGAGLGMLTGMPVGGLLSHYLSWQWIFLATFPVFVALFWFGYKNLAEVAPSGHAVNQDTQASFAQRPLNWYGLVLSALVISLFVLSISLGSELGWRSPVILTCVITGLVLAALLCWRARHGYGLFSQALMRNPGFILALTTLFIFQFVNGGVRFMMPFYLELGLGLTVLSSSALLLLYPLSFSPTGVWAGRLSDHWGAKPLILLALFLSALLCAAFAFLLHLNSLWIFGLFVLFLGFLTGLFSPANNRYTMQTVPVADQNEASALLPVALNMGTLVGTSVFDSIFSFGFPQMPLVEFEAALGTGPFSHLLYEGFTHVFIFASLALFVMAIGVRWFFRLRPH